MFFQGTAGGPERLHALLPTAELFDCSEPSRWADLLRETRPEILVTSWSTPALPIDTSGVALVCHVGGTVRNLIPRPLIERGLLVTNWGDSVSEGLAEAALFHALSALRRGQYFGDLMHREKGWSEFPSGTKTLFEKRVGIHGFGAAARNLVRLLAPFRVEISAYSAGVPAGLFQEAGVRQCQSLADLFASSEVLFELEGLTPATRGVVNREILERLPPDAVFVNVARGALIDEAAAAELATAGRIRLALDVFACEPLSIDSPLRSLAAATLTPHLGSPTDDRLAHCGDLALANLQRFRAGQPLDSVVSLEIYDRST
ncbi:MAG: phosphoglycerate dehydrogenase [Verrucomicrobia bacterium]|nr:phosphoglycerate dehydrogenase [Verrucomicrobiota bacterium]